MNVFLQDNFDGYGDMVSDLSAAGASYAAAAGSGTMDVDDAVGTAGIVLLDEALPGDYRITINIIPSVTVDYLGAIVAAAAHPVIAAKATFDATRRMWAWTNGFDALHFCVLDTAGDIRTWDGDSWETGTIPAHVTAYTQTGDYQLVIEMGPDHKGRFTLYDDDGAVIEQTGWIDVYGANTGEAQWLITGSPYVDEPFSAGYGFDGQQVEPCFYKLTGDAATITINDKVTFDCGGAAKSAVLNFQNAVNVDDDFELRLDIDLSTLSSAAAAKYLALYLYNPADPTDYIRVMKYRTGTNSFYFQVYLDGSQVYTSNVTSSVVDTTLRIVRAGTNITAYFWSGAAWTTIGTYSTSAFTAVYPAIVCSSNAAANIWDIDNFQIVSGTISLINRSSLFARVSGYELEMGFPECRLANKIGFEEVDFPSAWGGDTVELVNAIRQELGWDFDIVNSVGSNTVEADFTLINTIGGPAEPEALPEVVVLLDGAELRPGCQYTQIQISEDIDRPPNQITIDIADEALYRVKEMYLRSDAAFLTPRIDVYVDGDIYDSYYWEDLKMSEDPKSTTWQIWGRNAAARLFMPFAAKITATYETTTRYALMKSIIESCGLTMGTDDYQVADFTIPGGLLVVEDEYPMDVLRQLAEADGAVVRSGRNDTIVVRYREYVIESDSGMSESYPGHNYVLTSGGAYIELS